MRELRQVAAYFVALLGLFAAGYAAAGWMTDSVSSLVRPIEPPQTAHLPAEGVEPAVAPDADRSPVWIAPTPTYSYDPPSGAERARQSAKNDKRRDGRRSRSRAVRSQGRKPAPRIIIVPFQHAIVEPR
jgi:hypothetical protein